MIDGCFFSTSLNCFSSKTKQIIVNYRIQILFHNNLELDDFIVCVFFFGCWWSIYRNNKMEHKYIMKWLMVKLFIQLFLEQKKNFVIFFSVFRNILSYLYVYKYIFEICNLSMKNWARLSDKLKKWVNSKSSADFGVCLVWSFTENIQKLELDIFMVTSKLVYVL